MTQLPASICRTVIAAFEIKERTACVRGDGLLSKVSIRCVILRQHFTFRAWDEVEAQHCGMPHKEPMILPLLPAHTRVISTSQLGRYKHDRHIAIYSVSTSAFTLLLAGLADILQS
jgi:hypothetical protein